VCKKSRSSLTFGICRKKTSPPEVIDGRTLSTVQTDDESYLFSEEDGKDDDDDDDDKHRSLDRSEFCANPDRTIARSTRTKYEKLKRNNHNIIC